MCSCVVTFHSEVASVCVTLLAVCLVLERRSPENAVVEGIVVFGGVVLSGVGVDFLRMVLFVAHSFQVQHLDHFV